MALKIDSYVTSDIEKFRLVVEELEVCREMIKSSSHVKSRTALILIDNLAEILAVRYYERAFNRDKSFAIVQKPRLAFEELEEAKFKFHKKISILEKLGGISEFDATVLKIGHQYRNAAFHRDVHNPSTIKSLAMICFRSVCHLFVKNYDIGISYGGMSPIKWLTPYDKNTTQLNFHNHSQIIANKLLKGITKSALTLRKHFLRDIMERLDDIEAIRSEVGYCNPDSMFNDTLRFMEFSEEHPYAKYAEEYYTFIRWLARTKPSPSGELAERLHGLEAAASKKMDKELGTFKATISTKILDEAKSFPKKVASYKSADQILKAYQQLDFKLSKFEYFLWKVEGEWDRYIDQEIDFARGK